MLTSRYVLISLLFLPAMLAADNWPQWRGPQANGVAAAGKYPVRFSNTENVAWKVPLPGRGSSTPAVWEERIFVTGPADGKNAVLCFNRDGKEQWRTALASARKAKHKAGTSANSSPVTDGKTVFVYFLSGDVAALDFDGKVIWKDNLQERYGKSTLWWDLGTSPVLTKKNVVIAVMQEGDSYLVALDKASGKVAWKTARMFDCTKECDQAYTTPTVLSKDGVERIVCWGADHLTSHDALTGRMMWSCGGFNPTRRPMWRAISSHAVGDGVAVVSFARGKSLGGIDIFEGTPEDKRWLWKRSNIGCDAPTPAVRDGRAYIVRDRGRIASVDIRTGKDIWTADLPKGTYYASPVLAGDLVYYTSFDGVISVGRNRDTFELLATNRMNEKMTATPIPIDGKLLVRGFEHLFCIGK
jgi:outer membrane protein assembly factor BamB